MILSRATTVIGGLFVLLFLTTSVFGLVQTDMAMGADGRETTENCFMPGMPASLCQMSPLEHISTWQNMFAAVPNPGDMFILLLLLLALVRGSRLFTSWSIAASSKILAPQSQFLYFKRHIPIINTLQGAFSSGILHPKIF